ncbi:MAG: R3H domain-containing nucleic acid-binding protein [Pseudomonadota bacterium]
MEDKHEENGGGAGEETGGREIRESDLLRGVKLLREIIDRMQMDVIITTSGDKGKTIFISGPDSGLLLGKKGQTLDALHFIFNRIVHRKLGVRGFMDVDVDGYRSRREKTLRKMALELAEKAKSEGKVIPIKPMNPRERRIVHLALSEVADIRTESLGHGEDRYVQIIPINKEDQTGE